MKAISTHYLEPTDHRGARIVATAEGGHRVTVSYPYELSGTDVHAVAAVALARKLHWKGTLIGGGTAKGYVFVFEGRPEYDHYPIDAALGETVKAVA